MIWPQPDFNMFMALDEGPASQYDVLSNSEYIPKTYFFFCKNQYIRMHYLCSSTTEYLSGNNTKYFATTVWQTCTVKNY
jgi:hypothetical protein